MYSMLPAPPIPLLRLPLRLLPDALHAEILARLFNHLLRGQTLAARLAELEGRSVCVHVRDCGAKIHFRIAGGRLAPAWPGPALVTIAGDLKDFLDLATRTEDPDTLFFQRRLAIEGETETGLHVKNLLDALDYDWPAHVAAVLGARAGGLAAGVIARLRPPPRQAQ
jgi:predicted lipid carrier protein YhbT